MPRSALLPIPAFLLLCFTAREIASSPSAPPPTNAERWASFVVDFALDPKLYSLTARTLPAHSPSLGFHLNPAISKFTGRNLSKGILYVEADFIKRPGQSEPTLREFSFLLPVTDPEGHAVFDAVRKCLDKRLRRPRWSRIGEPKNVYWRKVGTSFSVDVKLAHSETLGQVPEPGPYVIVGGGEELGDSEEP